MYISFLSAVRFTFSKWQLLAWSGIIWGITVVVTIFLFSYGLSWVDAVTPDFFDTPPQGTAWYERFAATGWHVGRILYQLILKVALFYLAFFSGYIAASPFYSFLSESAENRAGISVDQGISFRQIVKGIIDAVKITAAGFILTLLAFAVNIIPVAGQILSLMLYAGINALMLIDFSASRRFWSVKKKVKWVINHPGTSLRITAFPTILSFIPVINIFFLCLLYPFFVVHASLNVAFSLKKDSRQPTGAAAS